jgi:hypothetical protein
MARLNKRGRNNSPSGRFGRLPHEISLSPAYRSLSPNARALLVEFVIMDTGQNNGSFWLSVRDGAARIGLSNKDSAAKAFAELETAGFLRKTKEAHFSIKTADTSRARCWRLTFLYAPGIGARTDEWRDFVPTDKASIKRMDLGCTADKAYRKALAQEKMPVLNSRTMKEAKAHIEAGAVHNLRTAKPDIDAKPPNSVVLNYGPYSAVTTPTGSQTMFWRKGKRLLALPGILIPSGPALADRGRMAA